VKRFVAALAVLVLPLVGFDPTAHAAEEGACTITGTMTFTTRTLSEGMWAIGPAVIDCQGLIGARQRITGRGPFRGAGTFTALPPGDGACLRQAGTGKVDYTIPTSAGDILISEPESHTLAGAGALTTPGLRGAFELPPPYDGDCLTKPVSRVTFIAEVVLHRYPRDLPNPKALPGGVSP
jgi:hypothetical protein